MPYIIIGIAAVLVIWFFFSCVRIVPQATEYVIEFLGKYKTTWGAGLHVKIPFFERIAKKITLKEIVLDSPPQPVITKDNVTMQIDTVIYYQITDPKYFVYGVENPMVAIENLAATTLRNLIGELELDQTLTSRETINTKMRASLDLATDPWGIKVNRVEVKNIIPPREIQAAMEKQMKAERERREAILQAEGQKQSAILKAQGDKEAAILQAEAQKEATIKEAEGHAESIRLHKEAEAAGLVAIKEAEANGVRMLLDSGLSEEQIVRIRSLQALEKAADGKATKVIIPSDIQKITGMIAGVKESVEE